MTLRVQEFRNVYEVNSISELEIALKQRYAGEVNSFWLTHDTLMEFLQALSPQPYPLSLSWGEHLVSARRGIQPRDLSTPPQSPAKRDASESVEMTAL